MMSSCIEHSIAVCFMHDQVGPQSTILTHQRVHPGEQPWPFLSFLAQECANTHRINNLKTEIGRMKL